MKTIKKGQPQELPLQKTKKAFTLVELIIVITILAILATIAFVSFQGYMKGARDSARVGTLTSIQQGIDVFQTTTGNVPMVDNQIGTGTISGNAVTYVGTIGDTITKLIKMDRTPVDPGTSGNFIYATDMNKTKYQLATVTEDLQSNTQNFITQTYADGGVKARVLGNYNGLLKYNGKIYNIPSLIITFSGATTQDLLATTTNYIIDKSENLPYLAGQAKIINTLTPTQILQKLTSTGAALTVTGITLPTDAGTWNSSSGTLQASLGYPLDTLGQAVFGNDYYTGIKSTTTSGGGGGGGGATTCPAGQGYNGTTCITATQCTTGLQYITLSNGQVWSCMNLGATTVRDGTTQPTNCGGTSTTNCNAGNTFLGDYYQWGRNEPVNTATTVATYNNATFNGTLGHNNFVLGEATYGDWWQNEAGSTTPTRWSGTNPQGPCPTGWHIPSQTDWQTMCNTVLGTTCANGMAYNSLIATTLRLPFAGYRNWSNGYYYTQSSTAGYWSSSPFITYAYTLYFNTSTIFPANNGTRGNAFSVRCIKN